MKCMDIGSGWNGGQVGRKIGNFASDYRHTILALCALLLYLDDHQVSISQSNAVSAASTTCILFALDMAAYYILLLCSPIKGTHSMVS